MRPITCLAFVLLTGCSAGPGGGDTALPRDCRDDLDQFGFAQSPECGATAEPGTIGAGPRVLVPTGNLFFDGGKLILASGGGVYSVDLDTGARTVISGRYEDPAQGLVFVGTGDEINPLNLVPHHDGTYVGVMTAYAGSPAAHQLFRVDPRTGAREVYEIPSCAAGPPANWVSFYTLVNQTYFPIAVAPDGRFVVMMTEPFGFDGRGLALIDERGGCEVLSFESRDTPSLDVGSGPDIFLASDIEYGPDGMLYVADWASQAIVRIDPVTKNRLAISVTHQGVTVGEGEREVNPTGEYSFTIHDGAIWSFYTRFAGGFTRIDLADGSRTGHDFESRQNRPHWCAPVPKRDGVFACIGSLPNSQAVVSLVEPETGNYMIISN